MTDLAGPDGPDAWDDLEGERERRRPVWVVAVALVLVLALVLPILSILAITFLGDG